MYKQVAILGASRGLGLSLAKKIFSNPETQLWLSSRKIAAIESNSFFNASSNRLTLLPLDFTKPNAHDDVINSLKQFGPDQIIYCAGGGPYGDFQKKSWQSHLWTFNLNLIFPAQLTHTLLSEKASTFSNLKQIIFIGSSVAEEKADPGATSYSASKHGLKGLVQSLIEENHTQNPDEKVDLRLYSPSYMNTDLLPKNSKPRLEQIIDEPDLIADDILNWATQPVTNDTWRRSILNG